MLVANDELTDSVVPYIAPSRVGCDGALALTFAAASDGGAVETLYLQRAVAADARALALVYFHDMTSAERSNMVRMATIDDQEALMRASMRDGRVMYIAVTAAGRIVSQQMLNVIVDDTVMAALYGPDGTEGHVIGHGAGQHLVWSGPATVTDPPPLLGSPSQLKASSSDETLAMRGSPFHRRTTNAPSLASSDHLPNDLLMSSSTTLSDDGEDALPTPGLSFAATTHVAFQFGRAHTWNAMRGMKCVAQRPANNNPTSDTQPSLSSCPATAAAMLHGASINEALRAVAVLKHVGGDETLSTGLRCGELSPLFLYRQRNGGVGSPVPLRAINRILRCLLERGDGDESRPSDRPADVAMQCSTFACPVGYIFAHAPLYPFSM